MAEKNASRSKDEEPVDERADARAQKTLEQFIEDQAEHLHQLTRHAGRPVERSVVQAALANARQIVSLLERIEAGLPPG